MTAIEIIQNSIDNFLEDIKYLFGENRKKCISTMSQFQIFEKTDNLFYKQECFMHELEDGIRKQLVIKPFLDLLKCDGILKKSIKLNRIVTIDNRYIKIDNYGYDDKNRILFSIDGIGYRFTTPLDEDVNLLLHDYELSGIEVLNFFNHNQISNNEKVAVLSPKAFFEKYFLDGDELYNNYFNMVTDAIEKAESIIGYKTVSFLSMQHLNNFKSNLLKSITDMDFAKKVYKSKNKDKNVIKYNEIKIECKDDEFNEIDKRFRNNLSILLSEENFAKCFITAEYLYQTIKEQNHFDYTSIVCGYLKAIEELLYCYHASTFINEDQYFIFKECATKCKSEENCVKYNRKKNQNEKCRYYDDSCIFNDFRKKYYSFSTSKEHLEIGGLILQLMLNNDLCLVSQDTKNLIWQCFDDYRKTCRNEHFHKDNIYDWDEVERIRNNSYICIFYLLGAFSLKNNYRFLTYSDEYSRLYKSFNCIISSVKCFIIEANNGEEIYAMRPYRDRIETPDYDKNTAEIITPIILLKVKSFNDYNYGDKTDSFEKIIIDKNNIPKRMYWYSNYKKYEIKW